MRLHYTGPGMVIRRAGGVEWSAANDHTAEAPVQLAADLLTLQDGEFVLAETSEAELAELAGILGCDIDEVRSLLPQPAKRARKKSRR